MSLNENHDEYFTRIFLHFKIIEAQDGNSVSKKICHFWTVSTPLIVFIW